MPGLVRYLGFLQRHRAFRNGDDAEILAALPAAQNRLGDAVDVVRNLGQQDHVGTAGDARTQCQPAGAVAHDLDYDDAMVAVRGAVQAVDGIGGDAQRGIETEGDIGAENIVVDGLGQGDDVETFLLQLQCILLRTTAAETNKRIQVVGLVVLDDDIGHVLDLAAHLHLVRLVAAGAENGAADREDAGQGTAFQSHGAVLHQSAETVPEADYLHAVLFHGSPGDAPDRGVETGTVAACREDADVFAHVMLPLRVRGMLILTRDGMGSALS